MFFSFLGGQMVIAGFCVDDQNQYLGRTNRLSKHDMFLSFTRIWGDFVKEGKITQVCIQRLLGQYHFRLQVEVAVLISAGSSIA